MLPPEHDNEVDTPERQAVAQRTTWVSVAVNLLLTLGQVITGFIAGSQGLIADGIHSLSDLVADFVVLIANRHSSKDADADHHYGHYRFETAASFVLGGLLLAVGAGMVVAAAQKLAHPSALASVQLVALWVALAALAAKELLFRYMLAAAQRIRSSMLIANAWHARSDAASSLVVALGIAGNLLGYPILDPVAALIVGFMVGRMGWDFAWDALHDLMDRAVEPEQVAAIAERLCGTPGVQGIHDLRTRKMGDLIVADVHLEVAADLTVRQGHDIAVEARRRVVTDLPVLDVLTHVDPV